MKRYWVLLACIICLTTSPSFGFGGYSTLITPIENSFYGVDYAEEKDEARLQRLEETVYGEAKTGDIKTRLNKLRNLTLLLMIAQRLHILIHIQIDRLQKSLQFIKKILA